MTTSPRAGRFVAIAVLIAGAGAAWFVTREGTDRPQAAGAEAHQGEPAAPSLGAPGRAEAAVAAVPAAAPDAAALQTAEDALRALVAAVATGEGLAIQDAIEALSRAICVEGGLHRAALQRVLDPESDLTRRASRAVVLALGRCDREDVLRALVAALKDPATSSSTKESIVLSLAQPREAKANWGGRTSMGIEDAQISGPIRERFVIDALLDALARTAKDRGKEESLFLATVRALVGSAGDYDDVFEALLGVSGKDESRHRILLFSLSLANPSPRITDHVRRIATDRASEAELLRGAMGLWMKADRQAAFSYARAELASSDATDVRKALIVASLDGVGGMVPAEDIPLLERLVAEVTAWARAHPRVVTHHEFVGGPEGTPRAPVEMDVVQRATSLALNAHASARSPSGPLRTMAVDAMVANLVAWAPASDRVRPARWITGRIQGRGGEPFLLELLERLRSAPVPDDTLVDVLDAVHRSDAASGPQAAAVLEAAAKVGERLPPAARAELEERRRQVK
jgi:hypothetical protein